MSNHSSTPPSRVEIFGLPLIGVAAVELFHNAANELYLFFIPFVIVVLRLFHASLQRPRAAAWPPPAGFDRAVARMQALNQLAAFVLLIFECGAVMVANPTVPKMGWVVVAALFGGYVLLRLWARRFWIKAVSGAEVVCEQGR